MKNMSKITYRLHRYFISSKPVVPLLVILCFLGFMYTIRPMDVNSGFIVSAMVQFCLMTFTVVHINGNEIAAEEQILYLRDYQKSGYYISREISLVLISLVYALLLDLGPVYVNCVNHFEFFRRALTVHDVVMGMVLIFGSGLVGIAVGDLFHPQVMRDRKVSLMMTALLMLLAIGRDSILAMYPKLSLVCMLIPPAMEPAKIFGTCEMFEKSLVAGVFGKMLIYYLALTSIKILLMNRNRFR